MTTGGAGGPGVTNESDLGLPPLSADRRGLWDFYKIAFLDDGYPGRRAGGVISAHPLYGAYVISDYLVAYRRTRERAYLDAARRVADAALRRMEPTGDALAFMYEPGSGISSIPNRFYSGLTQARYLAVLARLYGVTREDRYLDASRAVLTSLQIPTSRGGVTRSTPGGGCVIEEYTHEVPDYILNGWATATLLISEYARSTGDQQAAELLAASRAGIRDVLPLYDVPELANSRYRLGGLTRVRLAFTHRGVRIADAGVVMPGQGTFGIHGGGSRRWVNRYLDGVGSDGTVRGQVATAEVILSRVTWPAPNRIVARLSTPQVGRVEVQVGQGEYQPMRGMVKPTSFVTIAQVDVASGVNSIDVPVPWVHAELVAYPTNFTKRVEGRYYNSYHFIHVDTLTTLAQQQGDDMFTYFAERWSRYPERWPDMPVYANAGIALHRYGTRPASRAARSPGLVPTLRRHAFEARLLLRDLYRRR